MITDRVGFTLAKNVVLIIATSAAKNNYLRMCIYSFCCVFVTTKVNKKISFSLSKVPGNFSLGIATLHVPKSKQPFLRLIRIQTDGS